MRRSGPWVFPKASLCIARTLTWPIARSWPPTDAFSTWKSSNAGGSPARCRVLDPCVGARAVLEGRRRRSARPADARVQDAEPDARPARGDPHPRLGRDAAASEGDNKKLSAGIDRVAVPPKSTRRRPNSEPLLLDDRR